MTLTDEFEWYAGWAIESAQSPLYGHLARGIANDPELVELVCDPPEGQPAPQLLLGAVHYLLLGNAEHRLARWYPTCVADPIDPSDEDPIPAFRDFCLEHRSELQTLVSTRRVSTNAVGRSAILYPAFARIAYQANNPLAIIEIGASAGLNLRWDQYHYRYDGQSCGSRDSPVKIDSTVRTGDPPLPTRSPTVTYRHGVDLDPPDPIDPDDSRWLRALVVPEHRDRFERLNAALTAARDDPPPVETGDAVEILPELLQQLPAAATPCVFSTHVRYQMDEETGATFDRSLRERSCGDRLHLLHTDNNAEGPGNGYRHVVFEDGECVGTDLVGAYESYGRWIEWYAGN